MKVVTVITILIFEFGTERIPEPLIEFEFKHV
jgi:hypothetical protein